MYLTTTGYDVILKNVDPLPGVTHVKWSKKQMCFTFPAEFLCGLLDILYMRRGIFLNSPHDS